MPPVLLPAVGVLSRPLCCSVFRRPYYLSHFLPALLTPRVVSTRLGGPGARSAEQRAPTCLSVSAFSQLPTVEDARAALIEALRR